MDRDGLLRRASELDDPAEISWLLADAMLGTESPLQDPLDADLIRALAEEQNRLGHDARSVLLLEFAVRLAPDWLTLQTLRTVLQNRGDDLVAVARIQALLPASSEAANTELFDLYRDLGYPALAQDAHRHGISVAGERRTERLRLWWITGGPLRPIRSRIRRRETARLEKRMSADRSVELDADIDVQPLLKEIVDGSDRDRAAWRLLRRVDRLAADGDVPAAARLLIEPLSAADASPRLIWAAVELAGRLDDPGLALRLTARLDPRFGYLKLRQAELYLDLDRLRDAWTLVQEGGNDGYRLVRERVLRTAGLPFLAVEARRTTSRERSQSRRRWWLTGGPLWFVRARGRRRDQQNLSTRLGPAGAAIEVERPDVLAAKFAVAAKVREAIDRAAGENHSDAAARLGAIYDSGRPTVPLLDQLAWALYFDDQEELALQRIREARAIEPGKASLLDAEVTFLKYLDRYVEALDVSDRYIEQFGQVPEARAIRAELLSDLAFATLSFDAFGPTEGLGESARALRRRLWWRTGGPLRRLRDRMRRSDETTLELWRTRAAGLARVLGSVTGPSKAVNLRFISDHFTFREARERLKWQRFNVVARLTAGFSASVAGGITIALAGDSAPLWSVMTGVLCAAVILALLRRADSVTRAEPGDRLVTRVIPAIVVIGVAGYLLSRADERWAFLIGATMVGTAVAAACRLFAAAGGRIAKVFALRRLGGADPRGFALVALLEVLSELRRPALRNDLGWRRHRLRTIEQVAIRLEADLPGVFAADSASSELLRRRGRGAAAAIRELKYLLVTAPPGSWQRIEIVLRKDIVALATGSLGRLRTVESPEPRTRRRPRRQIAFDSARTLFFAGLPLAVTLTAQPWLRFNETILNWARLLTIGWAVLYVLLTADPTFRDKLRTGFALINLGRGDGDPAQLDSAVPDKRPNPTK
ncbi:hypothetical protein [Actinoplanes sp. NBRC 103695]|uniref:hypothetical protein n=1 Tax=Actinoplanes sp. NBRC 103695 TaxID=3032202 RepID=UPI002553C4F7|nr:hypothetical protein [Actinoplanes sp. NBRC 103695]